MVLKMPPRPLQFKDTVDSCPSGRRTRASVGFVSINSTSSTKGSYLLLRTKRRRCSGLGGIFNTITSFWEKCFPVTNWSCFLITFTLSFDTWKQALNNIVWNSLFPTHCFLVSTLCGFLSYISIHNVTFYKLELLRETTRLALLETCTARQTEKYRVARAYYASYNVCYAFVIMCNICRVYSTFNPILTRLGFSRTLS